MDLVAEYDYGLAIKGRFRLADGSKTSFGPTTTTPAEG